MNGRRLFREYAISKGYDAQEFVKINSEFYDQDEFIFKDRNGKIHTITISYKDMIHWIIKNK